MRKETKIKKKEIDDKIIAGLERISSILRILIWEKVKKVKLSPIQIQFLQYLENHSPELCIVSNLAEEFGLSQATVSDAIRVLVEKNLIIKTPSQKDGRFYFLRLTPKGKRISEEVKDWSLPIKNQLKNFPNEIKEKIMVFLMELITSFQKEGIINIARMCLACRYFKKDAYPGSEKPHHCLLTNQPLAISDLKVDCENNEPKIMENFK
ncbi:MarR family winged helix-turn-helix transcriptional regulator [Candidatus Aminicenantes bacterium AH-873-B07]|jgi:DNA-binding MarR family transcriptional regulator|nr:MarR family winged helix-turn-helix transcriptional regulator [Candidatus Aminicenantes bacterium AH-873-B07]